MNECPLADRADHPPERESAPGIPLCRACAERFEAEPPDEEFRRAAIEAVKASGRSWTDGDS